MSKKICKAKKQGIVKKRGRASIEYNDEKGKPVYYCYGWKDASTEELLQICKECTDNVIYAQSDLEKLRR